MDEARLAEIEQLIERSRQAYDVGSFSCELPADHWFELNNAAPELIAEVRRLQAWQQAAIAWVEMMREKYPPA